VHWKRSGKGKRFLKYPWKIKAETPKWNESNFQIIFDPIKSTKRL
jgi:hypothetical protein